MYQDTVTLFNRKKVVDGDSWYPTVLHNVNLNMDKGMINKTYGEQSMDNAVLNVRYAMTDGEITVSDDIIWKPPKEWQRLADRTNMITFTSGKGFDFFWAGEWEGGIEYDATYGDMSFYDYMLANYDYVFAVTGVGQFSVIPHFEITGR